VFRCTSTCNQVNRVFRYRKSRCYESPAPSVGWKGVSRTKSHSPRRLLRRSRLSHRTHFLPQLGGQRERIVNCCSRGSVIENTPYPCPWYKTCHLRGERIEEIIGIGRIISAWRAMEPKISQDCQAPRPAGSRATRRVGGDTGNVKFLQQIVNPVTEPAAMAWFPNHVSCIVLTKQG
jgi:hypothetical protein